MPPPVFRFAPSPNGYLHLGHAYSALLNFDLARRTGGRFLLRIEDIDITRCKPEFETAIYEDLAWLGMTWETPVRRQSEHLADYRDALEKLSAQGLVYPSFESRAEIARLVAQREANTRWPRDPDGAPLYPGAAKLLSSDERARLLESDAPYVLRLDMAAACARAGTLSWIEHGGGNRRRLARRERSGARPGSVLVDQRPSAVATAARLAAAGLPAPPPHPRWFGAKTLEVDRRYGLARTPRRGCDAGRHSPPGRPALIAAGFAAGCSRRKTLFGVTPRARPWHGKAGQGLGGIWRQNRAHSAPRDRRNGGRRKNALQPSPRATGVNAPP